MFFSDDLDYKVLTYDEALGLILPELNSLKETRSLRAFCNANSLPYHNVQLISIKYAQKQFPDTLQRLLEIFGYKIEREKAFKIFNNN